MDEFFGSDDDDSVHKETAPAEAEEDIFGSDDEDTNGAGLTQDAKMEEEELFGSENEGENTAVNADSQPDSKQKEDLDGLFGSDDEAPAAAQTKVRTQSALSLPALKKSIPAGAFGVSCTMPNFVKIQPRPYVPGEHLAAEEEERFQGAIDMVRWRFKRDEAGKLVYDKDGKVVKESNARLVKWTDGSYQLIVGSTVFQAEMLPVHDRYSVRRRAAS